MELSPSSTNLETMDDLSTIRRYELKYTITESMASEIRDYISNICSLDPNVPPGESQQSVF